MKNLPLANNGRVRKAPRPARFSFPNPSRVCSRSPAGSRAAVQRSERTTSHEDFCIRSTSDGPPPSLQPQHNRIVKMQSWSKITHYAGFDWATDHHDVVIVNRTGKIVADFQIEHTAQGWQRWREQVAALGLGWLPVWRPARALSSSSYWKAVSLFTLFRQRAQSLSPTQSAQRQQNRPCGRLESGRCLARRWPRLESAGQRRSSGGRVALALPRRGRPDRGAYHAHQSAPERPARILPSGSGGL